MIRRLSMTAIALLVAVPLAAQVPAGMQMRVDRSTNAADPDDVPDVTVAATANGFQVNTGPAVVAWNPANTASGTYTLSGSFTLQAPSGHNNYYGLIYGGRDLAGASQAYSYFVIGQNGSYTIKYRMGDMVHDVVGRTPHDAVVRPGDDGRSVNRLEVRVMADRTDFVANGQVLHSAPRAGSSAPTDGIYGVRINHQLPGVLVENLSVTR